MYFTYPELAEGFKKAFKNADDHFTVASLLADQKYYGFGLAHLILSSEESVKALNLAFGILKNYQKPEELKKLFSSHKDKHKSIQKFEEYIKNSIESLINELNVENSELEKHLKKIVDRIKKSKYKELNNANFYKNSGFYVDFKNEKFISPKGTRIKEFKKYYQFAWELLMANEIIKQRVSYLNSI